MRTYLKQSVITITLATALSGLSSPSFAGGFFKKINYADLNLDQPGDVTVLYGRIQDAAGLVCKDKTAIWGYHRKSFNRCFEQTMDKAVMRIDNTALTLLHRGQNESVAKR